MRKDITIEKLILGGEKMNKSELSRQYGCCWRTIDRRLNPEKYKKEKVIRIYKSKLDPYYPSSQTCSVCDNIDKKYKRKNL